jgi:hypothetical protein
MKIRIINEMSVGGIAAPDATSQGVLSWNNWNKKKSKKKKLEEGSQFGGYGTTISGSRNSGTFTRHTNNLDKKIKNKIKENKKKEENNQ